MIIQKLAILAFLPSLTVAFYPYLPEGYKKAPNNIHIGNQISRGFNDALAQKKPLHRHRVPVSCIWDIIFKANISSVA
jgi:hypothetical protein